MSNVNTILTIILSLIAVIPVIAGVVGWVLNNWAIKQGLIRPQIRGHPVDNWPNGWHNLPDTLEGIDKRLQHLETFHNDNG